jgi:hypothetical protein
MQELRDIWVTLNVNAILNVHGQSEAQQSFEIPPIALVKSDGKGRQPSTINLTEAPPEE